MRQCNKYLHIFYNSSMKYVLNKDLPTFKAGTEAWLSKRGNLLTKVDGKEITMYNHSTLAKFPNILTEWFTPVEEKRKVVPVVPDDIYIISHTWYIGVCEYWTTVGEYTINQGNWRWTREEAEAEVKKRAAIERVRRYLCERNMLSTDHNEIYYLVRNNNGTIESEENKWYLYYSPYGRIKNTDLTQFLEDCQEDLLIIHS